jgi:hypothetical protein
MPHSYNVGGITNWNSEFSSGIQSYEIPIKENYQEITIQADLQFKITADSRIEFLQLGNEDQNIRLLLKTYRGNKSILIQQNYGEAIKEICETCTGSTTEVKINNDSAGDIYHRVVLVLNSDPVKSKFSLDESVTDLVPGGTIYNLRFLTPYLLYGNINNYKFEDPQSLKIFNLQAGSSNTLKTFNGANLQIFMITSSLLILLQIKNVRKIFAGNLESVADKEDPQSK